MAIMIVGADHLGTIEKNLKLFGIDEIEHITGRNVSDRKRFTIPLTIQLIVVLIDYVNHITAKHVKEQAKAQGVQLVFAKRNWCSIQSKLVESGYQCEVRERDECVTVKKGGYCPASVLQ